MPHGTWKTTGGGGITAGGVLAVAGVAVAIAERKQLTRAAGDAVEIVAIALAVVMVLAAVGIALLVRYNRRQAAMFAARRLEQKPAYRAEVLGNEQRSPAAVRQPAPRALPAPQPQIHNHFHLDPATLAAVLHQQQGASVIPASGTQEVPR